MSRLAIRRTLLLSLSLTLSLSLSLTLFCIDGPSGPPGLTGTGSIEIRARIVNPPLSKALAQASTAQTLADRIIVEVRGADLAPTQFERKLDLSRPSIIDTVTKVPVGKNRTVRFWAVDKNGNTTHIDSIKQHTVNIETALVTPVFATLIPNAGSIYLHFTGLTTAVSGVYAAFIALGGELLSENKVARAARTFMSVDNIPHEAAGVLRVCILDAAGDTLRIATREMVFDARSDNVVDLQFLESSGAIGAELAVYAPGVTTASYNFANPGDSEVTEETGELIITEIMWNAGNDNYIELHNPSDSEVRIETLTTDVDGVVRDFANVSVGPGGYVVIGRQNLPYVDRYTDATGGLPISTTGNWITVRRGRGGPVIDRVICAGNNASMGWPTLAGSNKRSIELARDRYGVLENNYGKNWVVATELIGGESNYYGTPGR